MARVPVRRWLGTILLLAGSGVLIWCLTVWISTAMFERREARRWSELPHQSSTPKAIIPPAVPPAPEPPAPGPPAAETSPPPAGPKLHDVIGFLEIPRLKVATAVLEGDDTESLRLGAGHIPGTPLPGAADGNVGIAAHRDSFFRALRLVKANDRIRIRTLTGDHEYSVDSTQIVKPSNVKVLASDGKPELTLVTCYPFYYIGAAPMRFVVHSHEVD